MTMYSAVKILLVSNWFIIIIIIIITWNKITVKSYGWLEQHNGEILYYSETR